MGGFDWGALGKKVAQIGAPLLGTVLGGPAGGAIGTAIGSMFGASEPDNPESVLSAVIADPEAKAKLLEFQMAQKTRLEELAVQRAQIDSQERMNAITQVNLTMREESKSEHWPQFSWRPFNGFMFPIAVILIYFILPVAKVTVPSVPEWIWILWGSVLGAATLGRNRQKQQQIAANTGQQPDYGLVGQMIQAIKK